MRTFAILVTLLVAGHSARVTATAPGATASRGGAARQSGMPAGCPEDCLNPRTNPGLALAISDLTLYHALIVEYRDGRDDVVALVRWWDHHRLIPAVALIDSRFDGARPWAVELLRSAATMETDAAIQCLDRKDRDNAAFHLDIAGRLLARGGPELAVFASRWVLAVSRLMTSGYRYREAEQLLETGRTLLPSDPIVLYESGLLQELFATRSAWPSMGAFTAQALRGTTGEDAPLTEVLSDHAARLEHAEAWLRQSVAAGPPNVMARLHLGRVEMMRRSNDEALRRLRGVIDATTDSAIAYLAAMFIGAVHEREDRLEEAAAAYQLAIDRFPRGQAAYVALSEVLQRAGRGEDARAWLRRLLTEAPDARKEPWAWYFVDPPAIARERVEELRAAGRR